MPNVGPMRQNSLVDIVIRGSGKVQLTRRLLRSIYTSAQEIPLQIVYVDGGSDRLDLAQLLTDFPGVTCLALPYNPGAVRSVNLGLSLALLSNAEYVLLLDSDCEIPKDAGNWLERWVTYFADEKVAAVGGCSNIATGLQQSAGPRAANDIPGGVTVLDDFALMLRKSAVEKTGLFDERFEPGLLEDFDYLIRLHEKGWQARIATDVWVAHKGGETLRKFDVHALMQSNLGKLVEKHGAEKLLQYGLEVTEEKEVEPDARKISLLVPTLNRPLKLKAMLESVRPLVEADGNIEVIVAPMIGGAPVPDYPWVKVCPRPESERGAVAGFNWCYQHATGDILVVGGDDVSYIAPDFFQVCRQEIAQLPNGEGMAESRTGEHGELEAMQALTRKFVETELHGQFMYPGYYSWFANTEWTARAMRAKQYRLTNRANVASTNPVLDGSERDATYQEGEKHHADDRALFMRRMADGFPDDILTVQAITAG